MRAQGRVLTTLCEARRSRSVGQSGKYLLRLNGAFGKGGTRQPIDKARLLRPSPGHQQQKLVLILLRFLTKKSHPENWKRSPSLLVWCCACPGNGGKSDVTRLSRDVRVRHRNLNAPPNQRIVAGVNPGARPASAMCRKPARPGPDKLDCRPAMAQAQTRNARCLSRCRAPAVSHRSPLIRFSLDPPLPSGRVEMNPRAVLRLSDTVVKAAKNSDPALEMTPHRRSVSR
jgi:hypothetical protein